MGTGELALARSTRASIVFFAFLLVLGLFLVNTFYVWPNLLTAPFSFLLCGHLAIAKPRSVSLPDERRDCWCGDLA